MPFSRALWFRFSVRETVVRCYGYPLTCSDDGFPMKIEGNQFDRRERTIAKMNEVKA
jgi:hypothetical protein